MPSDDRKYISLKVKVYRLVLLLLSFLLGYVCLKIVSPVKEIVFAFLIAVLINYLLAKPVAFLSKYIKVRAVVVLFILVAVIYFLILLASYMIPNIAMQFKALKTAIPALVDSFFAALSNLDLFLNNNYNLDLALEDFNQDEIAQNLLNFLTQLNISSLGDTAWTVVTSSFSAVLYLVLVIILSFYLLIDGDNAWDLFLLPFSPKYKTHLTAIKKSVDSSLYAFVLGQFQVALMTASVMLVTYLVLGVPYALILAIAQMLEIIPVVGTWVAIVPSLVIVGLTVGWSKALIALIIYIVYSQFVRDNFVAPRIMGNALGFHPLAIILAIIIGAKLGGAFGVVFALPILAAVNAVVNYYIEMSRLRVKKTMDWTVG